MGREVAGTASQRELWDRIDAFELDVAGASLTFTDRLARDNGWSPAFAAQVVSEYKRFIFLAMEAGHPVTPSDEVDQAWHLHLTYTRSYWDELCGDVLGRPLHHGPTKGGSAEGAKFDDWYAKTKESYERFFRSAPATHLWPPAAIRFGEATSYERVNRSRNWVVPKPRADRARVPAVAGAAAITLTG